MAENGSGRATDVGKDRIVTVNDIDVWESYNLSSLKPSILRELTPEVLPFLKLKDNLLDETTTYQTYTGSIYPDLPYVTGTAHIKIGKPRDSPLQAYSQISSLLNIPAKILKPRRRLDIRKEIGIMLKQDVVLVSDNTAYNANDDVYSHYEESVKRKRNIKVDDSPPKEASLPPKKRKICELKPQFTQQYAAFYNEELVEFVTGTAIDAKSRQKDSIITPIQSTTYNPSEKQDLEDSFIEGSHWTSDEKEKFFVFLGRRSRHDMAGIAEAVGSKTMLECEAYHNLLFREAQKMRLQSSEAAGIQQAGVRSCICMEDIPAAVEMSDAWIDIEEVQAQSLDNWGTHLGSECPEHSKHEEEKAVYYNPQVKVVGERKAGVLIDLKDNPFRYDRMLYGETEEFFEEKEPPFQHEFIDDPVNNVVRASSAMTIAHEFWSIFLDDELSYESASREAIQYIEGEILEDLNRMVIDHTRSIIRYVFNRLTALEMSQGGRQPTSLTVSRQTILSILSEMNYTLPRHSLLNSILTRENIDVREISINSKELDKIRNVVYNPLHTSWNSNLLLGRRDYQSAYSILREQTHQSLQKPLETNQVDDARSVIDFETDGSESDATKEIKEEDYRDFVEDREYLSDELLDYSAHAIGSTIRKKLMTRAIPAPRDVDEFTEDDIRDMIETVRELEEKKISHTALLERTLLALDCGRMPNEYDSDTEAHSTGGESDSDNPDITTTKNEVLDIVVGNDAEGNILKISMDALLVYEEQMLNGYDSNMSEREETKLIDRLSSEEPRIRVAYDKIKKWYADDSPQYISKCLEEQVGTTDASAPSREELAALAKATAAAAAVAAAEAAAEAKAIAESGTSGKIRAYKKRTLRDPEMAKVEQILSSRWSYDRDLLPGIDAEYLFQARLFVTQYTFFSPSFRKRCIDKLQQKLAHKARRRHADAARSELLEKSIKELAREVVPMVQEDEEQDLDEARVDRKKEMLSKVLAVEYVSTAYTKLSRAFLAQGDVGIVRRI